MAILNRTPDSFYDGGRYLDEEPARRHVEHLIEDGAHIIDVGAESTRPRAPELSAAEQIARLGEIVEAIVSRGATASIDTTLPEVAEHALARGATIVNSVGLVRAADLGRVAARHGADLVLTHCRGSMTDMTDFSTYPADGYHDVVREVAAEWNAAADRAREAGLDDDRLVFDPGLGFKKSAAHSLELCARLGELKQLVGGRRVLVGPSRKSYVAWAARSPGREPPPPAERLGGTIAAVLDAVARGADIVRVHDVAAVAQALAYAAAVKRYHGAEHRGVDMANEGQVCSRV
jgi:dihydropteroate synthase